MKFVSVREAKAQFSECLERAQHDAVVITKHGKPAAVIIGAEGKELEDVVLISDKSFWQMIRKSRRQPTVSLAEAEQALRTRRARKRSTRARKD